MRTTRVRTLDAILGDLHKLAIEAGDLGYPHLELAALNAARLARMPTSIQSSLMSAQFLMLTALDDCLNSTHDVPK